MYRVSTRQVNKLTLRHESINSVNINTLILKEAKGMTEKDKIVLFSLKSLYFTTRVASRIVFRERKRDRLSPIHTKGN